MIPWVNLARQHASLAEELAAAAASVIRDCDFVLGRHVTEFEERFAAYCEVPHAVAVNSGTSALHLALLAAGVGPGDEVITTAFTFMATLAAIDYTGARPVLVDIDPDTFTLDVPAIAAAITPKTRTILPVHLYGHPADMDPIMDIARRHGLAVIEDAAQAHGALYKGRKAGSLADAACFSFYPSKNLGACGEGGIVVTANSEWADRIRLLRNWGMTGNDGPEVRAFNYRMEGLQGAFLNVKLPHLDHWNHCRRQHARHYDSILTGTPWHAAKAAPDVQHVHHIYPIRTKNREATQQQLLSAGIETRIHYRSPMHLLKPWAHLGYRPGDFPEAERAGAEVLSIPVSPELDSNEVERIGIALQKLTEKD
jgi:dTDP-4-amino-4,6-dideoxygalactose transaminase